MFKLEYAKYPKIVSLCFCEHNVPRVVVIDIIPIDYQEASSLHHLDAAGAVEGDMARRPASNQRVALEEVERPQFKRTAQRRHHGEVVLAWDVVESQRVPQHDVLVFNPSVPLTPGSQAILASALHGVQPWRPFLYLVVRCHPHLLFCVARAPLRVVVVGQQRGARGSGGDETVPNLVAYLGPLARVHE